MYALSPPVVSRLSVCALNGFLIILAALDFDFVRPKFPPNRGNEPARDLQCPASSFHFHSPNRFKGQGPSPPPLPVVIIASFDVVCCAAALTAGTSAFVSLVCVAAEVATLRES